MPLSPGKQERHRRELASRAPPLSCEFLAHPSSHSPRANGRSISVTRHRGRGRARRKLAASRTRQSKCGDRLAGENQDLKVALNPRKHHGHFP